MPRKITKRYQDPLDIIWINVAKECGIKIVRDDQVFASWNGMDLLTIGTAETLDADDSLAQMILHELCHALVAGPESAVKEDWGLDYENDDDQVFEQATLRLQAALADEFGLRKFFASTTDFRGYFDQLPNDPLGSGQCPPDRATTLASQGMQRLEQGAWANPIRKGIRLTHQIANLISECSGEDSLWKV